MPYYAVHKGKFGAKIYNNWADCKKSIDGFVGAIYKKFENIVEATKFMEEGFGNNKPKFIQKKEDYETNNQDEIDKVLNDENAHKNVIIYTDGSCIRDTEAKKVYCGYGIIIPDLNIRLSEPLNDTKLTNNRAEMRAILHAIELVSEETKALKRLCIFTDSQYCKYIFQGTGARYEKDGFMKDGVEVPNKDMIIIALSYIRKYNIAILKVRAHTEKTDIHSTYNDMADKLANEGAMKMKFGNKYNSKIGKPSNNIFSMIQQEENKVIHPFEKHEITKATTPEVEFVKNTNTNTNTNTYIDPNNKHRYNDKNDWREKEKEEFKNKTKLSQIFSGFTDDNVVEEKPKKEVKKKEFFNPFTDEDNNQVEEQPIKKEVEKKEMKKNHIFDLFTNKDQVEEKPQKDVKKEEKREVTVKIINNKVKKFSETKLSDFL